mmetsp:Transcript_62304/g.196749  ORF Transcript_62304/g.196749 Transcript_62304/m.196749 type:complete len:326 (+) Transcript_62304:68-1045(+)
MAFWHEWPHQTAEELLSYEPRAAELRHLEWAMEDPVPELRAPEPRKLTLAVLEGIAAEATPPMRLRREAESDNSTELGSDVSEAEWRSDDALPPACPPPPAPAAVCCAEETLIIFDWDDTLFPTTWLRQQGLAPGHGPAPSEEQRAQLEDLAISATQALSVARALGRVVVVTNAGAGWVELSCRAFLPELARAMEGVEVISARSAYESDATRSPTDWKCLAFAREVDAYRGESSFGSSFLNIVSLGDSLHEQQALACATCGVMTCQAKCIKFAERPDARALAAEHQEISRFLERIVIYDGDLEISALDLRFSHLGEASPRPGVGR